MIRMLAVCAFFGIGADALQLATISKGKAVSAKADKEAWKKIVAAVFTVFLATSSVATEVTDPSFVVVAPEDKHTYDLRERAERDELRARSVRTRQRQQKQQSAAKELRPKKGKKQRFARVGGMTLGQRNLRGGRKSRGGRP